MAFYNGVITMHKFITYIFSIVLLSACGGGGSGSTSSGSTSNTITMSLSDGQDVTQTDYIDTVGQTTFIITNSSNDTLNISKIYLQDNTVDNIDNSHSNCIASVASEKSCNLAINITNVYTTKQEINVVFVTDKGNQVIMLPVHNYNISTPSLTLTVESDPGSTFLFDNKLDNVGGNLHFTLTNNEPDPVYIDAISLVTPSSYDTIDQSTNLCSGTLYGHQSCTFNAYYDAVGINAPFIESFLINYRGGVYVKSYTNRTLPPVVSANFNCKNAGICTVNFTAPNNHKIIITNFSLQTDPSKYNVSITPTESGGCVAGLDLTQQKSCSYNVVAESLPAQYGTGINMIYRYYIDDNNYIDELVDSSGTIKVNIQDLMNTMGISSSIPSICAAKGGQEYPGYWQPGVAQFSAWGGGGIYHIKKVEFTPGNTNYEDYATKTLITAEQAVLKDTCTGAALSGSYCYIDLQAGCNGYGAAGDLKLTYTVDNNPTEFTYTQTLSDVANPDVEVSAGEGDNMKIVWKEGQPVPTEPIHINIPPSNLAGFNIVFYNWYEAGSYTIISDNYKLYAAQGIPNCFGDLGLDPSDNFYPTGTGPYCGVGMDFSKQIPGTSIPMSLSVGNRGQYTLNFIFDIE